MYGVRSQESHVIWGGRIMEQAFLGAGYILFHFVNMQTGLCPFLYAHYTSIKSLFRN